LLSGDGHGGAKGCVMMFWVAFLLSNNGPPYNILKLL
jgi:hypothetical protein